MHTQTNGSYCCFACFNGFAHCWQPQYVARLQKVGHVSILFASMCRLARRAIIESVGRCTNQVPVCVLHVLYVMDLSHLLWGLFAMVDFSGLIMCVLLGRRAIIESVGASVCHGCNFGCGFIIV